MVWCVQDFFVQNCSCLISSGVCVVRHFLTLQCNEKKHFRKTMVWIYKSWMQHPLCKVILHCIHIFGVASSSTCWWSTASDQVRTFWVFVITRGWKHKAVTLSQMLSCIEFFAPFKNKQSVITTHTQAQKHQNRELMDAWLCLTPEENIFPRRVNGRNLDRSKHVSLQNKTGF